eukprot:CAMPEP_0201718996 /NCGR_PEP_ID=MMETSP0593-20130828/4354_1 /ASSEMBLY_ACC=CAM_ASM_000672 /TAXON_ID=267983 /ORGANISM="Skeletonema japonicum, Strain CCMP2506" /LENGTH=230 /DNA_ID=CAMNT_0048209385 /DNA_START=109 /DNA_END=801 /DNA_ORIENTATION=-
MEKTNYSKHSGGGRSKNKTAAVAASSNLFEQFEMLALRDGNVASAKSKSIKGNKVQNETTSASSAVEKSSVRPPKKLHRNRGGKKKGKKKNALGAKPPAVVVEISEATVVAPSLNQKSSAGKNKKKNSKKKKESVAAAQDAENIAARDAENIPDNIYYEYIDGIHPEQYYHDLGYYYQYYPYYQNFYPLSVSVYENDTVYHCQYGSMPMAMADQSHALNIDAPTFQPQQY